MNSQIVLSNPAPPHLNTPSQKQKLVALNCSFLMCETHKYHIMDVVQSWC